MLKKTVISVFGILTLASCGGDGGLLGFESEGFSTLSTEAFTLSRELSTAQATPIANMPTGTFVYNGVTAFELGPDNHDPAVMLTANMKADTRLRADFTNNTIIGSMTGYYNSDNELGSGSVDLSDGTIVENRFTANAYGILTTNSDNVAVSGNLTGAFLGDTANSLGANFSGSIGGDVVSGVMAARR